MPGAVTIVATFVVVVLIAPSALIVPMALPITVVHVPVVIEPDAKSARILVALVRVPAIAIAVADNMRGRCWGHGHDYANRHKCNDCT